MEDLNRICAAMALFSALWTVPLYGQSRNFDLKSDVLGESIAQFKARNTQASCSRFSDVEVECKDPSASFAGHMPYIWLEKPGDCFGCGLAADFFRGKLTFIGYTVSNAEGGGDVLALLTEKFGKPSSGGKGDGYLLNAEWRNSTQHIHLQISSGPIAVHPEIAVYLEYNKNSANNDI
jgi:hypothetical protein